MGFSRPDRDDRDPRFLVDRTLGRLARWLRLLGYDTVWDPGSDPADLLRRAEEERLLLTRDTLLVQRRLVRNGTVEALLVRNDVLTDQLRQLRIETGLHVRGRARCLVCNGVLEERTVDKARSHVPTYVACTQTHFSYCPACDRYTWRATHCESARALLEHAGIFVGGSPADGRS